MAGKAKANMFSAAAEKRQKEQTKIEKTVKADGVVDGAGRVRKRGSSATTITLSISAEDKQALKVYAASHGVSASDLLHEWINQNC